MSKKPPQSYQAKKSEWDFIFNGGLHMILKQMEKKKSAECCLENKQDQENGS